MSSNPPAASDKVERLVPGEVRCPQREIALGPGRTRSRIAVTSTSARPVRVSSHYPFWQVNPRLEFDREAAVGFRLDLPAGATVRWPPGAVLWVDLVSVAAGRADQGGLA